MSRRLATDLYKLLNVSRQASDADIKAAYRTLAMKFHPDRVLIVAEDSKSASSSATSHQKFLEIKEAYETLSDATRRREYDIKLGGGAYQFDTQFDDDIAPGMGQTTQHTAFYRDNLYRQQQREDAAAAHGTGGAHYYQDRYQQAKAWRHSNPFPGAGGFSTDDDILNNMSSSSSSNSNSSGQRAGGPKVDPELERLRRKMGAHSQRGASSDNFRKITESELEEMISSNLQAKRESRIKGDYDSYPDNNRDSEPNSYSSSHRNKNNRLRKGGDSDDCTIV